MSPDELIQLLTSLEAAQEMAAAIDEPALQRTRGWDLARWKYEKCPEAVRFIYHDRHGRPASALLCVSPAKGCEWVYETALRLAPYPTTLLVLQPATAGQDGSVPAAV